MYLFKFFFGRRAFLSKYKSFFSVGKWTYSYNVNLILTEKHLYNYLFLYLNDFVFNVDLSFLSAGIFNGSLKIFYISIKDMMSLVKKRLI